jgi:hypothetical protein
MSDQTASLYDRLLRPLSPYGDVPGHLPSYRLFARVNDDRFHGIPRIACMGVWAVIGAGLTCVFWLMLRAPYPAAFGAMAFMLGLKIEHVAFGPRYKVDVLDWLCDVGSWGTAGAYTASHLLQHTSPDWRVYAALAALWGITYPWSTPK